MKRKIIAVLIMLFCISVFLCDFYGNEIRSLLTPRVSCCDVLYSADGYVLPEAAVRSDGETYVLLIRKSEKFPEHGYEAVRKDCMVVKQSDGMVFIQFYDNISWNEKAVTESDRPVFDGYKVTVE